MSLLPVRAQLASSSAGIVALTRRLGYRRALAASMATLPVVLGKDPFSVLGKAATAREKASRKQIAPAIALYGYLKNRVGQQDALDCMKDVIVSATLAFLSYTIGEIPVQRYLSSDESGRRDMLERIADRFFNADSQIVGVSDREFSMHVSRCDFPRLCRSVGMEELAPLFCVGDMAYFNRTESVVRLQRETTIAEGGDCCPFVFTMKD